MTDQIVDSRETLTQSLTQTSEVPYTLREFGIIPDNFVSSYITISPNLLDPISEHGLKTKDMASQQPKLEMLFEQERKNLGIKFSRSNCVFASPKSPEKSRYSYFNKNDRDTVLEVKIDPKDVYVADGELYTEAGMDLEDNDDEGARDWAQEYWQSAKPLNEYLEEQARLDEKHQKLIKAGEVDDDEPEQNAFGFNFPELLIPYEIPTNQIRVYPTNPK